MGGLSPYRYILRTLGNQLHDLLHQSLAHAVSGREYSAANVIYQAPACLVQCLLIKI